MADEAEGAGAVIASPTDRGRRKGTWNIALIRVDVGCVKKREFLHMGDLAGDKGLTESAHAFNSIARHHITVVKATEREMDVAGVAFALVELRHEGE
ncbi:unannotated protein [freshwater metagenome]|uniref:Unannotated protein n=1 Tax=freshwater metagenome TaxID=449393 RepID=A0A6J6WF99_9ZZZZ